MTTGAMSLLAVPPALAKAAEREAAGDWAGAEALYRAILAAFPHHPRAQGLLGAIFMRDKRFDEALALFEAALATDPSFHWIHNNQGCALELLGRTPAAVRAYREAARLRPDDGDAVGNLKRTLGLLGRHAAGPKAPSPGRVRVLAMTVAPDWWTIARLPAKLMAAGFDVAALCPPESFLAHTDFVCERHFLRGADIADALADAVAAWAPDLIIPGDEFTVHALRHIERQDEAGALRPLIRRSCGDLRFLDVTLDKRRTLEEAAGLGLRHPEQAPASELDAFAAIHGYPLVIKLSIGMAGLGVRVCADRAAALAAMAEIQSLVFPAYSPARSVIAQRLIAGHPASYSFVALEGALLDGFAYRPEESLAACGPSSVIRRVDHPEIEAMARRLIAHFGFTGFGGFDFMVEEPGGAVHLLEMNPRVTVSSHLGAAFGHDLPRALRAALAGAPIPPAEPGEEIVAIFPQEWWRDPASPHLKRHFADVPRDDPRLLAHVKSRKRLAKVGGPDRRPGNGGAQGH